MKWSYERTLVSKISHRLDVLVVFSIRAPHQGLDHRWPVHAHRCFSKKIAHGLSKWVRVFLNETELSKSFAQGRGRVTKTDAIERVKTVRHCCEGDGIECEACKVFSGIDGRCGSKPGRTPLVRSMVTVHGLSLLTFPT